ncbi:MFS transporter [Spirochaetia bacterium]|nr:MFS transporter [Spirochaetia bacterium]
MATFFLILIYVTFISLGLPDSLLGTAWPVIRLELGAPVETAGIIFITTSVCTIISSLSCSWITRRFGTGKVTALSVLLTAAALLGSSFSHSVWWFTLMALPLGFGAGAIDSALNNYIALHYAPRHMSWLHCFWGVGAFIGPFIISLNLRDAGNWRGAYLALSVIQFAVSLLLIVSLPLWKIQDRPKAAEPQGSFVSELGKNFSLVKTPGVIEAMITFFIYCATEYTLGLWGASFLTENRGFAKPDAASAIALYYLGITIGRFFSGFLTLKFSGKDLIRGGLWVVLAGAVLLALPGALQTTMQIQVPGHTFLAYAALWLIGFGCSPIFPSMLQLTPSRFGEANSQKVIGLQMASAYLGLTLVPPLVGLVAARTDMIAVPLFLAAYVLIMLVTSERINHKVKLNTPAA